jgi:Spy/CpxP family protein refolding chaperone
MTKNFATRALLIAGLLIAGSMATYAQSVTATTRRVAVGAEHLQPVATSAVALNAPGLNLTADQRTQLTAIAIEASSLQSERARLWAEYNALIARPDFSDEMAADEAAPRMLRIVAINNQLATAAARQESQVNSILTSAQRIAASKAVAQFRVGMAAN